MIGSKSKRFNRDFSMNNEELKEKISKKMKAKFAENRLKDERTEQILHLLDHFCEHVKEAIALEIHHDIACSPPDFLELAMICFVDEIAENDE